MRESEVGASAGTAIASQDKRPAALFKKYPRIFLLRSLDFLPYANLQFF